MRTLRILVEGRVQGVGFRAWVEREASRRGLSGFVRNRRDGSVETIVHGEAAAVEDMLVACSRGPAISAVHKVSSAPATPENWKDFTVLPTI